MLPVAFHRPDLPAGVLDLQGRVVEDLAEELPDDGGIDPGRAEPGADFRGRQVGRDDLAEFLDVDGEAGIVLRGLLGGPQLVADVPGQVLRSGHELPGRGVVEDQRAQIAACLVLINAEQPGNARRAGPRRRRRGRWRARRRGCPRPAAGCGEQPPGG